MLKYFKKFIDRFKEKNNFKKALKYLNTGEYGQAENILVALVDSNNLDLKMVYFNLSAALIGNEKFEEAELYLKKAIKIKNNIDFFWGTLGEVYILQEKWLMAEDSLQEAIKLNKSKKLYKDKLSIVKGNQKIKDNYLKYYYLVKKALKLQKEEKWEKSIDMFKKALEYNNMMGYAYNQIGAIYNNKLNDAKEAIKYFELALEKEPENKMFKMNYNRVK